MTTSVKQAILASEVLRECLMECNGDVEAGLAAAEYILSTDALKGGKGDERPDSDFDPKELARGILVELEHTDDFQIAKEIAKDHLTEDEDYYKKLEEVGLSVSLAHDIHNKRAQSILNQAMRAAKSLSKQARSELAVILKEGEADQGGAILNFITEYRQQLAELLTAAQMAALMEGAREVALKVPQVEIDAEEVAKLVGEIPLPSASLSLIDTINSIFATVREAARSLFSKNVMTQADYDALDAQARAKAFTVAGVDSEETLTKIRDALAKNVDEGASHEAFRKEVLDAVDTGTFMSDTHLEGVFRTSVQTAFSDGQATVLNNPVVRNGFPYSSYDAIHDDRARANHLALEHHGINGTNIYRNDDPVFHMFRPPWDWNDRCSWTPITVRQAAEAGVPEAQEWHRTGVEPTKPAHVKMPPFQPPKDFQRAFSNAPLSIRLSAEPMDSFGPSPYAQQGPPPVPMPVDDYPRDKSNRFLDKLELAEASRNPEKLTKLRESVPDEEHAKFDRTIAHLQSGGTIHHPKDPPGLAVDTNGRIVDVRWAIYSEDMALYEIQQARASEQAEQRKAVERATKSIRAKQPDWDRVEVSLKEAGATNAELRLISKARHRAERRDTDDAWEDLEDTCEDVAEAIHARLDEPVIVIPEPKKPSDTGGVPFGMVGDEWRGPTPPGKGWVPIAPGPRGGKRWRRDPKATTKGAGDGRQQPGQPGRTEPGRPGPDDKGTEEPGRTVEAEAQRTGDGGNDTLREGARKSPRKRLTKRDRERIADVSKRLKQYARAYRKNGQEYLAELMEHIDEHISTTGIDIALSALGEDKPDTSGGEEVQYVGTGWFEKGELKFLRKYLDQCGISLHADTSTLRKDVRTITSAPVEGVGQTSDVKPIETNLLDKLQESKLLPGLESSEDINDIVGRNVRQISDEVITKLDEKYGKGKWIIKSYGDEAYAGFGVLFPQRLREIQRTARSALLDIGRKLKKHGFVYERNDKGNIAGISKGGTFYAFNSDELDTLPPVVKKLANMAEAQAPAERGARLPATSRDSLRQDYGVLLRKDAAGKATHIVDPRGNTIKIGSKQYDKAFDIYDPIWKTIERAIDVADTGEDDRLSFFASPAFKAVGVSEADRRAGSTWESSTEGRVHVITKDGKASAVPYATLGSRHDSIPAVFPNDDIKAMERAVEDAINALPESERAGQTYAPDVIKTTEGWRVVELNASTPYAESMWLEENPLVIDAYVSHVLGREPSHVKFVRGLFSDQKAAVTPIPTGANPDEPTPAVSGKTGLASLKHTTSDGRQPSTNLGRKTGKAFSTNRSYARAPKGGVTIQGQRYEGGEFIPGDVMSRATDEEVAAVEGKAPAPKAGPRNPLHAEILMRLGLKKRPEPPQEKEEEKKEKKEVAPKIDAEDRERRIQEHILRMQDALDGEEDEDEEDDDIEYVDDEDELDDYDPLDEPEEIEPYPEPEVEDTDEPEAEAEAEVATTQDPAPEPEPPPIPKDAGKPATPKERKVVAQTAESKLKNAPFPSEADERKAKEGIAKYGLKKYRKNRRGNAPDRRKRRALLLKEFGDGATCPCVYCGVKVGEGTVEQSLIYSISEGGRYRQNNIVPSCSDCNLRRGKMTFEDALKKAREHAGPAE